MVTCCAVHGTARPLRLLHPFALFRPRPHCMAACGACLLSSALARWLASKHSDQSCCLPALQDEESEVASAESRRRTAEEEALNADFEKNVVIM